MAIRKSINIEDKIFQITDLVSSARRRIDWKMPMVAVLELTQAMEIVQGLIYLTEAEEQTFYDLNYKKITIAHLLNEAKESMKKAA